MALTPTPVYTQTPKHAVTTTSSIANTNEDGTTGTYTTVFTAGNNGCKIERLTLSSVGTNTADKVRLFLNNKIWKSFLFSAVTPSNTVTGTYTDIDCTLPGNTLVMSSSEVMTVNVNTAGTNLFNVHVFYGDY